MNQRRKCKRRPGGLHKQEKIEKTHKRESFENLNITIHNRMSKYRWKVMMKWQLGLMSSRRVIVCIKYQIVGFNTMTWLSTKTSWANLRRFPSNISRMKQNKWKVNWENKLIKKHCMSIIKVIKKNRVKLIIFKDWIVQFQINMRVHNLIMKSRIYMMIYFIS